MHSGYRTRLQFMNNVRQNVMKGCLVQALNVNIHGQCSAKWAYKYWEGFRAELVI